MSILERNKNWLAYKYVVETESSLRCEGVPFEHIHHYQHTSYFERNLLVNRALKIPKEDMHPGGRRLSYIIII